MEMRVENVYYKDILPLIPKLAELRIKVFRDYPYLYEGSLEYEKNYLQIYTKSTQSVIVAVFDGDELVGAATAIPLRDEADYIQKPFLKAGMDITEIYYFGESVLLKEYRGRGLGHKFFEGRQNAALKFGFQTTCFCAVERIPNHPMKPANYGPLDGFWIKRGYKKHNELRSEFSWPDIGETSETLKPMIYWIKEC